MLPIPDEHHDVDDHDAESVSACVHIHLVRRDGRMVANVQFLRRHNHNHQHVNFHHDINQWNRNIHQHVDDGHKPAVPMPGSKYDDFNNHNRDRHDRNFDIHQFDEFNIEHDARSMRLQLADLLRNHQRAGRIDELRSDSE